MNDKEHQKEISQLTGLSGREQWSDETLSRFHHAALGIISATLEDRSLFLPMGVYWRYKEYVKLTDITYAKIQREESREMPADNLRGMYHSYLKQAELQYRLLYRLITSAYRLTTYSDEHDDLYDLIHAINQVTKEY